MKNKTLSIAFVLVLIFTFVTLTGCGRRTQVFRDADGNKVEVQHSGDTMTITGDDGEATIQVGDNLSWPKGNMGDLPAPGGKILTVIDTPQGFSVTCEEISKSDYQAYVEKLKGMGFETAYEMEADKTTIMYAGEKDDYVVSVQLHLESEGGTGTCIIIYGES